eukprot:TRINITY_DN7543_c0_g2_i1.p1 TRINITY_DN7543_c0_g2~~TRINITY_DN7543_c0_g2_i1.p1  ORF type:complete len:464 (+),score=112.90 TRINITY_DN7543_c0_g2_i1:87-1394(+)
MARAIAVVDPFSSGAVFCHRVITQSNTKVYRVLSRDYPPQQLSFVPPGLTLTYADTIQHNGDFQATVDILRQLPIDGVAAGCEGGVELSDALSEALGIRTNGSELSPCRRDKYLMQERLRACGLRAIQQMRIGPDTPWQDIQDFLSGDRCRPLEDEVASGAQFAAVIKPVRSCGTDGVTYVTTYEEVKQALEAILGHENQLGTVNEYAVLQEYLQGTEHVVDTVSMDGIHKTVAIWEYDKRPANGGRFVYCGMKLLPGTGERERLLVEYVHQALNALGILNGPSHAEVMLCRDGYPCLVEVGARLHGVKGSFVPVVNECIGYNKIDVAASIFTDPSYFHSIPAMPRGLLKFGMQIFLIASVDGIVKALPRKHEIESKASYRNMNLIGPGERVMLTRNGWSSPGNVTLVNESEEAMLADYESIVKLVSEPSFFELE